jgi:hypothetical protein
VSHNNSKLCPVPIPDIPSPSCTIY